MNARKKGAGYTERTALIQEHLTSFSQRVLTSEQPEQAYYDLCQIMRHARVMRGWLSKKLEASE